MLFLPSRDAFLTNLQTLGRATASLTASDDLAVAVDAIRHHAATLGVDVRIWPGETARTLTVEVRDDAHEHTECPACGSCHDHDRCPLCGVGHPGEWDCPPEHGTDQPPAGHTRPDGEAATRQATAGGEVHWHGSDGSTCAIWGCTTPTDDVAPVEVVPPRPVGDPDDGTTVPIPACGPCRRRHGLTPSP